MKYLLLVSLILVISSCNNPKIKKQPTLITIGVVTYGGYAPGMHYNKGFKATETSRYFKNYNLWVNFEIIDDYMASRKMFENGDLDLVWMTLDAFSTEYTGLEALQPKFIFASSFSRGADAIVARRGIEKPQDLIGKSIAVAELTPSHTLLLAYLEKNNISEADVQIEKFTDPISAAQAFKYRQVDAAIVWSPDDQSCVNVVKGASVLASSKDFPNVIIDGLIAREAFIQEHKEALVGLFKGWTESAALIKKDSDTKIEAVKILKDEFEGFQDEDIHEALDNVHLCTLEDNKMIFGLMPKKEGEFSGQDIFDKFAEKYQKLGYMEEIPQWKEVVDQGIIEAIK